MEVTIACVKKRPRFSELNSGELFVFNGNVFIKVNVSTHPLNARLLGSNGGHSFTDEEVSRVVAIQVTPETY